MATRDLPTGPDAVDKTGGVQRNDYEQATNVQSNAIKQQTMTRGHNVFRPDVYRVSEGVVI